MAIARAGVGAGAGTESNGVSLDLVCPATVAANDILIAHVMHTGASTNPTTPSGWSLLYPNPADITQGAPIGTGTPTARQWAFGKLAVGNEDGTTVGFGTGGGTNGRAGRIYSFSGYVSGTLADVVPAASFSDAATETDPSGPSVTTTVAGALAIALMAQDDDNSHTGITGQSGGTWGDYLQFTSSTLGPQGLAMAFNSCTPDADPGTVSGGTLAGTNDESGTIGFEIRPNVPTVTHETSGTLAAAGAAVAGAASSSTARPSSGALTAGGAILAGTAARTRVHATDGVLAAAGATVAGNADRQSPGEPVTHDTTGALVGTGSAIAGAASSATTRAASGALTGAGALVVGSAARAGAPVAHASSGALVGHGSTITGAASRPAPADTSGAGFAVPKLPRIAVHHSARGRIVGRGAKMSGRAHVTRTGQNALALVMTS